MRLTLTGLLLLAEVYLVLQLVLQRYAAKSLVKDSSKPAEVCLNSVIAAEPQTWTETFRCAFAAAVLGTAINAIAAGELPR